MGSPQQLARLKILLPKKWNTKFYAMKTIYTMLFAKNKLLGYLLMLLAMSYNGGVVLAIVGGLSVGFLRILSVGNFNGNIHHQEEDE